MSADIYRPSFGSRPRPLATMLKTRGPHPDRCGQHVEVTGRSYRDAEGHSPRGWVDAFYQGGDGILVDVRTFLHVIRGVPLRQVERI